MSLPFVYVIYKCFSFLVFLYRPLVFPFEIQETRNTYEPYQQTTTTEQQIPYLGQVQTIAAGLNVLMIPNLYPYPKQ